jgi:hypothetical protein
VVELENSGGKLTYQEGVKFEEYQFARLCYFLRWKKPIAEPGYTFLIFRLTDAEVMRALYGGLPIQ